MTGLTLKSPDFENEGRIPEKYTCDGANISPPLWIRGVPEETQTLVLILDDPDAPGGVFDHWILWNIDPDTNEINEGEAPDATHGKNDFDDLEYGGPCPPSGTHRYRFKLYALDSKLDLPEGSEKEKVESAMEGKIIESAKLVGLYSR